MKELKKRGCGVLLPISALPSPYGIGTLGKAAYEFADQLKAAGQSYWQLLPVGPTSYGDSPYQSFSTYAGNPYFVDLEFLCADGLLQREEIEAVDWGDAADRVDYGKLYAHRFDLLEQATERGWERDHVKVEAFAAENSRWLPDYALFMALKRHFGMKAWTQWEDEEIRLRRPEAVERYGKLLWKDVRLFTYVQFLFFMQWNQLRDYVHRIGIELIGDLPIYVALDSADVWAEPQWFQLNEENRPTAVAGVPPDYFSAQGQLWGNPLYDWEALRQDGFGWWIRRMEGAARLFDMVRIDHFRGLESYWAVEGDSAKEGCWRKGPGMDLVRVLTDWFPQVQMIAEDLGLLTPEVRQLLRESGLPGMKVLEFAFDGDEPSDYLPHVYEPNCVCYVGTHDNAPVMGWKEEAKAGDIACAREYLGLNEEEGFAWGVLRGGLSSVAKLFVAQMQDYMGLDSTARMNTPGTVGENWRWRLLPGQFSKGLAAKMAHYARLYGRCPMEAK